MANPTNLNQYYQSKGQALPTLSSRAQLFQQYGLGDAKGYQGTAQQNTTLLGKLMGGGQATPSPQPAVAAPAASPAPSPSSGGVRSQFVDNAFAKVQATNDEWQKKSQDSRDQLVNYYKGLEDPTTRFNRLRTENGLPQQEELVNALSTQVLDTDKTINDLEGSVNTRSKDFLMNDADRVATLAREREPHQKVLVDLLKQKEREEVGMSGRQGLVRDLLQLSFQGDERGAKPFQLGVDFTDKDRQVAQGLITEWFGKSVGAFNADQDSADTDRRASEQRTFQEGQSQKEYERRVALEKMGNSNSIGRAELQRKWDLEDKTKSETDAKKKSSTDATWNNILANSKTESDVWSNLEKITKSGAYAGLDLDDLWNRHAALAGKIGRGKDIREIEIDE